MKTPDDRDAEQSRCTSELTLAVAVQSNCAERAIRFPFFDHFLTIRVQSIINDPLGSVYFMIVLKAKMPKSLSDSLQADAFQLVPQCIIRIGSIDYFSKQNQRRVRRKLVFLENRFKGTFLSMMSQLCIRNVVRNCLFPFRYLQDLVRGNEEKFGLRIDELLDQPGTSHPVHFNLFSSNPFHGIIFATVDKVPQSTRCLSPRVRRHSFSSLPSRLARH